MKLFALKIDKKNSHGGKTDLVVIKHNKIRNRKFLMIRVISSAAVLLCFSK